MPVLKWYLEKFVIKLNTSFLRVLAWCDGKSKHIQRQSASIWPTVELGEVI